MKYIVAIIALMTLSACSDPDNARDVLIKSGYTDIKLNGYSPFWCGEGDTFTTTFTAKNPNGMVVSGAVCSGFTKGGTVRF